jgi:hypothetical protein
MYKMFRIDRREIDGKEMEKHKVDGPSMQYA